MFSKASQVLRGGKMGERTQSQPHLKHIGTLKFPRILLISANLEDKNGDSPKKQRKGKFLILIYVEKRPGYKKRTASERRNHKQSSGSYKNMNFENDQHTSISNQSSNHTSNYKSEPQDFHTVKHTSTKIDKHTPKKSKYSSKGESSTDRHKNTSKISSLDKNERQSSRKRERDKQGHRGKSKNIKFCYD
jgi:hypothetical protein